MEGTKLFHIPSLRSSFQNSALSSPHKSNLFTGCEVVPQCNWVLIVPALTSLGKGRQTYGSPPMLKALCDKSVPSEAALLKLVGRGNNQDRCGF